MDFNKYLEELFNDKSFKSLIKEETNPKNKGFHQFHFFGLSDAIKQWDPTSEVAGIIIDAKWGAGKTTYIKAYLNKQYEIMPEISEEKKKYLYIHLQMAQLVHDGDLLDDITYLLLQKNKNTSILKYLWSIWGAFWKYLQSITGLFYLIFFILWVLIKIFLPSFIEYFSFLFGSATTIQIAQYFTKKSHSLAKREIIAHYVKKNPTIFVIDEVDTIPEVNFAKFMDSFRAILNIPGIFYIFLWDSQIIKQYFENLYKEGKDYYEHFCIKNISGKDVSMYSKNILKDYVEAHTLSKTYPVYTNLLLKTIKKAEEEAGHPLNFTRMTLREQKKILRDKYYKGLFLKENIMHPFVHTSLVNKKAVYPVDINDIPIYDINLTDHYFLTIDALLLQYQYGAINHKEIEDSLSLIKLSYSQNYITPVNTILTTSFYQFCDTHEIRLKYYKDRYEHFYKSDIDANFMSIKNYYYIWLIFTKKYEQDWDNLLNHLYSNGPIKIKKAHLNILLLDGGLLLTLIADYLYDYFRENYYETRLTPIKNESELFTELRNLPKKLQLLFIYYTAILCRCHEHYQFTTHSSIYLLMSNNDSIWQNSIYLLQFAIFTKDCFTPDDVGEITTLSKEPFYSTYPKPYIECLEEIEHRVIDFYKEIESVS